MRIPITMSHGIRNEGRKPLPPERFVALMDIVAEFGAQSINYDQLAAWRGGTAALPARPIMLDFDHAVRSMADDVAPILAERGLAGNLFINTGPHDPDYDPKLPMGDLKGEMLGWDEIGRLMEAGWHIGAHTVTHPNLAQLAAEDPTGERIAAELDQCNAVLKKELGVVARDFAFTGTSWSAAAEAAVMARYRFGRLWIVSNMYQTDGGPMRYAELVGVAGDDLPDGGPPTEARYITRQTPPYRLPSMEIQGLIHEPEAFRVYLDGAWDAG